MASRQYQGGDDPDSDNDIEIMDPDHPAMQRVQQALERQYKRRIAVLDAEISSKAQNVADAKQGRETIGVDLYNIQQQLARFQVQLEQMHDVAEKNSGQRAKSEALKVQAKEMQNAVRNELRSLQIQADTVREEMVKAGSRSRTVELHNDELKSKVALQKRVVSKTATEQEKLETEKQQQDLYVYSLQERLKELNTELAMSKKQKEAQVAESIAAKGALREATAEVESIAMERRELQQQWSDAMAGLARRDEALSAMNAAVLEEQQKLFGKEREVEALKKRSLEERDRDELQSVLLSAKETDIAASRKKLEGLKEKQDAARKEFALYTRTLHETEAQLSQLTTESNKRQIALKNARELIEVQSKRVLELETDVATRLMDHAMTDKAARLVAKNTNDVRNRVFQSTAQAVQLENDIARQVMIATEAEAVVDQAKEQMVMLEKESSDQQLIVQRFEFETKRNTTDMNRKQSAVDLINRKIDAQRSKLGAEGAGDENLTPSDIEIMRLQEEITQTSKANADQQQKWLSHQRELVNQLKEEQAIQVEIEAIKTKTTLLQEKKMRVDAECETQLQESKDINRAFKVLQSDVVRLNTLITTNKGLQQQLLQDASVMETEFLHSLKEDELKSIQMQARLVGLQDEKAHLINAVIEAEQQLLLWEKKIQLAKETKAQINASEGKDELDAMRAEVHRMELRLGQVDRAKEQLICEMELSVDRREHIVVKAHDNHLAGKNTSQNTAKKEVLELLRKVKQTQGDIRVTDTDLQTTKQTLLQMETEFDKNQSTAIKNQAQEDGMRRSIETLMQQRSRNSEDIIFEQQLSKRLQSLLDGRIKPRYQDAENYEQSVGKAVNNLRAIGSITEYVAREHSPSVQTALQKIRVTIDMELNRAVGVSNK